MRPDYFFQPMRLCAPADPEGGGNGATGEKKTECLEEVFIPTGTVNVNCRRAMINVITPTLLQEGDEFDCETLLLPLPITLNLDADAVVVNVTADDDLYGFDEMPEMPEDQKPLPPQDQDKNDEKPLPPEDQDK